MTRSPSPAVPPTPSLPDRAENPEGNKAVTARYDSGSNGGGARVWTWLMARRNPAGPPQLCTSATTAAAENHSTLDEASTAVAEALYAELERELSGSPAYQNTAYNGSDTDADAPVSSSAPSSAYYSD